LAQTHYENFPVGRLVPKKLRHHVHAVYAFARVADDLADEGYADPRHKSPLQSAPSEAERLHIFRQYRQAWQNAQQGLPYDPTYAWIFAPLQKTQLPRCGLVQGIGALELGIAGEMPRCFPCHLAQLAEQFAEAHHGLGCGQGEAG
jgi:hypothetical protein